MANARNKKMMELEKMQESDDWLDPPPKYVQRIKFRFPEPPRQRRGTARLTSLASLGRVTHGYGEGADQVLFRDANFSVGPGDKIGVVGRNGSGKSTLLRLLMGVETPSGGGDQQAANPKTTGFFTQHQADLLPEDMTALQVVEEGNQIVMGEKELYEIMKKFRFKGDRLHVPVEYLSGGEKARLAIVRMMLCPAQLLIFDEPTNHFDIPMKETLEYSLREFEGAVVVVSHDRWFLSQTCTRTVAIQDGKVETYEGDFRYYMDNNPDIARKIEQHYLPGSGGIDNVPLARSERKKRERGGLRKNWRKRQAEAAKESFAQTWGRRR